MLTGVVMDWWDGVEEEKSCSEVLFFPLVILFTVL